MFTGIVSALGKVTAVERTDNQRVFRIVTPYKDVALGESIAVNGVCLTATEMGDDGTLQFYASHETCARTNLGALTVGRQVNLERALRFEDRLSGHIVQGHVDGVAPIVGIRQVGESHELDVELPRDFLRYVIAKGSICLDGISLTVNSVKDSVISLTIIPHTWTHTNLFTRGIGDNFNVELDMIAKYVERITQYGKDSGRN